MRYCIASSGPADLESAGRVQLRGEAGFKLLKLRLDLAGRSQRKLFMKRRGPSVNYSRSSSLPSSGGRSNALAESTNTKI